MSRRTQQVKEHEQMRKDRELSTRVFNREEALIPLQNTAQGKPGDRVLYQSLIVRFEDIQINKWKKKLIAFPKNKTRHEAYTKKELEAEIKHYEKAKEKQLCKLGKIVYEPVIAVINEQEQQERQQDDGDVVMSENIGGKKRRKSRRKSRRKKRTRRRRKSKGRKRTRKRRKSRRRKKR